jgi:hypothetical protein
LESPRCNRLVHEAEAEQRKIPEVPYKKMAGEISKVIHHNRRCSANNENSNMGDAEEFTQGGRMRQGNLNPKFPF